MDDITIVDPSLGRCRQMKRTDMECLPAKVPSQICCPLGWVVIIITCLLFVPMAGGNGTGTVDVVPDPVDVQSIRQSGVWDNFTLSWAPTPVEYGLVTYDLVLEYEDELHELVTTNTWHQVTGLKPYTTVNLTIQSRTDWKSSQSVHLRFKSPMSVPSVPRALRSYVKYQPDHSSSDKWTYSIDVEIQWGTPEPANGIVTVYRVQYRYDDVDKMEEINGTRNPYFVISDANKNTVYYFQVSACTSIGCSELTDVVEANTAVENPSPILMLTTKTKIIMIQPDVPVMTPLTGLDTLITTHTEDTLITTHTCMVEEGICFYQMNNNKILSLRDDDMYPTKLLVLNGAAKGLVVDWIARMLYWIEDRGSMPNAIMRYDLNKNRTDAEVVVSREATLEQVAVNPYGSMIYWSEVNRAGKSMILKRPINGGSTELLLGGPSKTRRRRRRKRQGVCNCAHQELTSLFVVDHSKKEDTELFVTEKATGKITAMDQSGCHCHLVAQPSQNNHLDLPADLLAVDHKKLYWYNRARHSLNSVDKMLGSGYATQPLGGATQPLIGDGEQLFAYGPHLQPMPALDCLKIPTYRGSPRFLANSATSITLQLSPWLPPVQCSGISLPSIWYTIFYKKVDPFDDEPCDIDLRRCSKKKTFNLEAEVMGLEKYTEYQIQVSAHNYYTDNFNFPVELGPPATFSTKQGTPSAPNEVSAEPRTPNLLQVFWHAPAVPNGDLKDILYEIVWRSVDEEVGLYSREVPTDKLLEDYDKVKNVYKAYVEHLLPDTLYFVKVRACDRDKTGCTESNETSATTYKLPGKIWEIDSGEDWIEVAWESLPDGSISRHSFHYTEAKDVVEGRNWIPKLILRTENATVYNMTFTGLKPNTKYAFSITAIYSGNNGFNWPLGTEYSFSTSPALPGPPDVPRVQETVEGTYKVVWMEPSDGGLKIEGYSLQTSLDLNMTWITIYNGSDSEWVVSGLTQGETYGFKVAAWNSLGQGPYSKDSDMWKDTPLWSVSGKGTEKLITILIFCSATVVLLILAAIILLIVIKKRKHDKPLPIELVNGVHCAPDVEQATLR